MSLLRGARRRIPIVGGLIGLTGLIGFLRMRSRHPRPTGAELLRMSDAEFAAFIQSSGLRTVATAGLAVTDGTAD
jgi:hypothetical protein